MWLPIPAETGSNTFPVTPGPVHVPPESWAVRVTGGLVTHNVPTGVIVASGEGPTVMVI